MTAAKGYILFSAFMASCMLQQGIDKTLADICGRNDGGLDARVILALGGLLTVLAVFAFAAPKKAAPVKPIRPMMGFMLFTCIISGLAIVLKVPKEIIDAMAPSVSIFLKTAFWVIFLANNAIWLLWTGETYRLWREQRRRSAVI